MPYSKCPPCRPGELDVDDVDANLDGGALTVHIRKGARAQPRPIEIQGG
jgi:HSP20 family molecular chaperone IbpA